MSRRAFLVLALLMVAVAAAVRLRNAVLFPPLLGYDGFGHFTYIWYLSETGRVPLPTEGWSFFHPPLYYALMSAIWKGLAETDPFVRLAIGSVLMGLASLTHAVVSFLIVRRCFPQDRIIQLLAPGLMLFLPVHLYSAPFLGNEGLAAVLCSLSILALLAHLRRPTAPRSIVLGLALGLAMLTKVSALAVAGGALATLAFKAVRERDGRRAAVRHLAVAAGVMLAVCGWYYARNMYEYGTPLKLSRDEFMVRHVENWETRGQRNLLEYILFDPVILYRPQWPRGLPLIGEVPPTATRGPARESVLTGLYANTWYEGFNWWVLPPVYINELARRSGQALLTLGTIPTLLILVGLWCGLRALWRDGWDDTTGAMAIIFACMVAIFVQGSRAAPMHMTIKATYLMPVTVVFSYWFALGLKRLAAARPALMRYVALECAVLAAISATVFSYGLLFKRAQPLSDAPFVWGNIHGIVYYAARDHEKARELFQAAAAEGSHLGFENLAALAFEQGHPLEATFLERQAARLEPRQSFGTPVDRRHFDDLMQAEYSNSLAVMYHSLGWEEDARAAAEQAVSLDPQLAEAHYNLGVLQLIEAHRSGTEPATQRREVLVRRAGAQFWTAALLDPGFRPATAFLAATQALRGYCAEAAETLAKAEAPTAHVRRRFPVETGEGIQHSAAIGRRKHIAELPQALEPRRLLSECRTDPPPT